MSDEAGRWIRARLREYMEREKAAFSSEVHGEDRAWWKREAVARGTDWSSLLRQRVKVLDWVRAGRPPLSRWRKDKKGGHT